VGDYYRLTHTGGDLNITLEADSEVRLQLFSGTGNAIHVNGAIAAQDGSSGEQGWSNLPAGEYTLLVYDRGTGELPYDLSWNAGADPDAPATLTATATTTSPAPTPTSTQFSESAPVAPAEPVSAIVDTDPYESNDNPASATFLSGRTGSLSTASGLATVDANRVGDYYAIEVGDGPLALRLTGDNPAVSDLGLQLFEGVSANLHDNLSLTPDRTGGTNVQRWDNLEAGFYTVLVYGQQGDAGLQYDLEWSQA